MMMPLCTTPSSGVFSLAVAIFWVRNISKNVLYLVIQQMLVRRQQRNKYIHKGLPSNLERGTTSMPRILHLATQRQLQNTRRKKKKKLSKHELG